MSEHGVALLGAGIFAKRAHLPAIASTPAFTLKAVYSRSSTSAASLVNAARQYTSVASPLPTYFDVASDETSTKSQAGTLDDLLAREDIKTVVLSLPILIQPDVIRKAWRAGKNVVSEKPTAKDVKAAHELVQLYEREFKPKGLLWIIAEQFPYEPIIAKARELIAQGKIGLVRSFSLDFHGYVSSDNPYWHTEWRNKPEYQGGFLLDAGVHFVAGLRHILPTRLTAINATRTLVQPHLPPFDTLYGTLKSEAGIPGQFAISLGIESGPTKNYTFRGSKGVLVVSLRSTPRHGDNSPNLITVTSVDGETLEVELPGRAIEEEFLAFSRALVGGIGSPAAEEVDKRSGPRSTLKDLEFIEKGLQSGETGSWIEFD